MTLVEEKKMLRCDTKDLKKSNERKKAFAVVFVVMFNLLEEKPGKPFTRRVAGNYKSRSKFVLPVGGQIKDGGIFNVLNKIPYDLLSS